MIEKPRLSGFTPVSTTYLPISALYKLPHCPAHLAELLSY